MVERTLEEMSCLLWHSVVGAVKQCEWLLLLPDATGTFNQAVSALGAHVAVAAAPDATPMNSSPESTAFHRSSCDTKSSSSYLVMLAPATLPRVSVALTAMGADHAVVTRFLFHYLKRRRCRRGGREARGAGGGGHRHGGAPPGRGLVQGPIRRPPGLRAVAVAHNQVRRARNRAPHHSQGQSSHGWSSQAMRVREREYRDTGTCLPDALLHSALRYLLGVNSDMLTPKMHLRGVIDLLEEIVLHELSRCRTDSYTPRSSRPRSAERTRPHVR
jgi:hypothetical protein